jgi:hypothetical protein
MLVSKSQKLDAGDPIQLRIKKSEDLRQSIVSLQTLFAQYSAQAKLLSTLEIKIARELQFFYQGDNAYTEFVGRFSGFLKFKEEMVLKEIALFDKDLQSIKAYDRSYEAMMPYAKNYFKNNELLKHYDEKVPKLREMVEARRKTGKLSDSDSKRLMRNEKKLEDARIKTQVATSNIIELSNKLNLERFDKINPMVSRFMHYNLITNDICHERLAIAYPHEEVLRQKETPEFNQKFFVDMDAKQLERLSRSRVFQSIAGEKSGIQYKQNVQNNYYIINDPKRPGTMNNIPSDLISQNQENNGHIQNLTSNVNLPQTSTRLPIEQATLQSQRNDLLLAKSMRQENLDLSGDKPLALPYK